MMAPTVPFQLSNQAASSLAPPGYQAATVSFIWWSGDDSYMYLVAGERRHFCRLREISDEEQNAQIKGSLKKGASVHFRIDEALDEVVVYELPENAVRHRK